MKTLTIIRHAKSSWGAPGTDDFDRPLNRRGLHVAPLMGEVLTNQIDKPDVIITSNARRARTTAEIIAKKIGYPDDDIINEGLIYCATETRLLEVLRKLDESHSSAILFGHYPGVQDLANSLCRESAINHFPTCAAAVTELQIDYWGAIDANVGKLTDFLIPKEHIPGA